MERPTKEYVGQRFEKNSGWEEYYKSGAQKRNIGEKVFIEDKQNNDTGPMSGKFVRNHEQRKSGKALTIPSKGKIIAETPLTVKKAAGAVYRKSDRSERILQWKDPIRKGAQPGRNREVSCKKQQEKIKRWKVSQMKRTLTQISGSTVRFLMKTTLLKIDFGVVQRGNLEGHRGGGWPEFGCQKGKAEQCRILIAQKKGQWGQAHSSRSPKNKNGKGGKHGIQG